MGPLITLYAWKQSNKWLMVCTGQQIHGDPKSILFSQTWCRPKTALNLGLSGGYNNFRWMITLFFVCWILISIVRGRECFNASNLVGFGLWNNLPHTVPTREADARIRLKRTPLQRHLTPVSQNYSYLKCDTVKTMNFTAPNRTHNKLPPRLEAFPSINVTATFLLNKSSTARRPLSWTHPATLIVWGENKC